MPASTKGAVVRGDMAQRREAAQAHSQNPSQVKANAQDIFEVMRERIKQRGARGIAGLARSFKVIDDDCSGSLSQAEFAKAMRDYRITRDAREQQYLFERIDINQDGQVDYEEFLRAIVGEMSPFRREIALKAFAKMDVDGNGFIEVSDVKAFYNAKKHPEVMMGRKSEDEVLYEFLDTFEAHYQARHPESKASHHREVDRNEWCEYYNHVSMSIDDDQYFELMMTNAYNLNGLAPRKEAWGGQL